MRIDITKLAVDESRSNPMVVAEKYADCPIDDICFFMAVGGAVVEQCKYLKADGDTAECMYGANSDEGSV